MVQANQKGSLVIGVSLLPSEYFLGCLRALRDQEHMFLLLTSRDTAPTGTKIRDV